MKKYNISSTTNLTSDDKFFLGTGFMGAEFAFILVKGNEVIPQKNKKLRDILRELGIEI